MATLDELREWLSPGFSIRVEGPFDEAPKYRVTIPEFGVEGAGEATEEATRNALDALAQHLMQFSREGVILPDRTKWIREVQADRLKEATE